MPSDLIHAGEVYEKSPLLVFYELTRACDLVCRHCRANAQRHRWPGELTTSQARALIAELTIFPKIPLLVLTGGDPMKRDDLFELISYAASLGIKTALTPSATGLVTPQAIAKLSEAKLNRLAVSLDGATPAMHDAFRGVCGSFQRTLEIVADAGRCGLAVQINTTLSRHNIDELDAMAHLLETLGGIVMWSVFFLVPVGRAAPDACGDEGRNSIERLSASEVEEAFESLWRHSHQRRFAIKTTEAPHYRRFFAHKHAEAPADTRRGRSGAFTNDGKGVIFVSHTGEIYPSGFLPIPCGRFPFDSLVKVYQESPLLRALRDPQRLGGKCGVCEFRKICGGSRARAFAVHGDPLAAEPDCAYIPPSWEEQRSTQQRSLPILQELNHA